MQGNWGTSCQACQQRICSPPIFNPVPITRAKHCTPRQPSYHLFHQANTTRKRPRAMDTDNVNKADSVPTPAVIPHAGETSSSVPHASPGTGTPLPGVTDVHAMETEPSVDVAAPSSTGQHATLTSTDGAVPQPAESVSASPSQAVSDPHAMETEPAEAVPSSAGEESASMTTKAPPTPESDAPALGTRIEVLWKISHNDGQVEERWWGAVVQDRLRSTVGSISAEHGDRFVHILLYDAYGDFEEDVCRVAFLPEGTLLDISQIGDENKGLLDWRKEGEQQETQMSLQEFVQANQRDLREAGVPDDADLRFLSGMPAHVQMHMTTGYRVFADGVKEMLAELSQKHPEGYVVTERDVQEWCEKMKRFT